MGETTSHLEELERNGQEGAQALTGSTSDPSGWAVSFMDRLSETDRRALMAKACGEQHATGSVICREGDPGDALYVVQSGQVVVLKELSDGRPTVLGYRGKGEIVGEMSLVGQQPRFASVVADADTDLLRLDAADFPALMNEHPGISWAVLNVLNDRLYAADVERTIIIQEEEDLSRRLDRATTEAERLAELARVRKETIELIAHDLRTPLAVVEGCLEMLCALLPEESLASSGEILDLALRSAERLLSLVDTLLEAARREEPGASLVRRPVDVGRLLQTAADSLRAAAEKADIRLAVEMPPDLPRLQGDTAQLERVMINLLENAVSYTPSGGSIVVAAAPVEEGVELSVTDTGPGVPPEHRERIFERFTRAPGTKGRRKGFGLGLYFCRQVVKVHGGRIWVEPGSEGVGSRFVFTLPVETEDDHE